MSANSFVLTLSCPDRAGIVSAYSEALFRCGCNVTDAQQFNDTATGRFFSRVVFAAENAQFDARKIEREVDLSLRPFGAEWKLRSQSSKRRVMILVSRFDHCLADLLYRWNLGELEMELVGVISNIPRAEFSNLQLGSVPFHHLPITPQTKPQQEKQILDLVTAGKVDLIVLARYMQILSDDLAGHLAGRCINIHHSFLPGFKGAKPYHQAHDRGVKLIGATAHYVTGDLDEGPIIEQDVERISHRDVPADLIRKGRDIERRVLARAVRFHLEDRIFLNGKTTVVFP